MKNIFKPINHISHAKNANKEFVILEISYRQKIKPDK